MISVISSNLEDTDNDIISNTFDIILLDPLGNQIQPQYEVEICLFVNGTIKSGNDICLGYYEVSSGSWKCEDECLEEPNRDLVCGKTKHFTNFAILLTGTDDCGNVDIPSTVLYLSAAFAIVMICIVIVSVMAHRIPFVRRLILGNEAWRIESLRYEEKRLGSMAVDKFTTISEIDT